MSALFRLFFRSQTFFDVSILNQFFFFLHLHDYMSVRFYNCLTNLYEENSYIRIVLRTLSPIAMQNRLIEFQWSFFLIIQPKLRKSIFPVKKRRKISDRQKIDHTPFVFPPERAAGLSRCML